MSPSFFVQFPDYENALTEAALIEFARAKGVIELAGGKVMPFTPGAAAPAAPRAPMPAVPPTAGFAGVAGPMATVSSAAPATAEPELLRLPEVMQMIGMSRSWTLSAVNEGRFPKPVAIGRARLWRVGEVRQWVRDQAAKSSPTR